MSVFEELSKVNVNDHTENKNGLTYLSWAWAWAELKKRYPTANYKVFEQETQSGRTNYFNDGLTGYVHTSVTVEGETIEQMLPIMNYKNQSIPLSDITSFNVNTAIQRCLAKNIAMFGLGLYIYAGEDLPDEQREKNDKSLLLNFDGLTKEQITKLTEGAKAKKHKLTQADVDKYRESQIAALRDTLYGNKTEETF